MASAAVAPRRTQAERSASTRTRLLDATLECLIEQGVPRTTTAEVESRAGVSRGARLHHFPTKAALLSAAVEHLYERIGARYDEEITRVGADEDRFRAGLRLLWQSYCEPAHAAVLELFVAARTDPELRETLRELGQRHHRRVRKRANGYFPDLANRDAEGLFETIQAAFIGLAIRRMVHGEGVPAEPVLELIERLVDRAFADPERETR
jgi:AcrR family transcriptional regulator